MSVELFPFPNLLVACRDRPMGMIDCVIYFLGGRCLSMGTLLRDLLRWTTAAIDGWIAQATAYVHQVFLGVSRCRLAPPNFSLTKSPVWNPAAGRISRSKVPLATPTSSLDSPLANKKTHGERLVIASFSRVEQP